jgi:cysteine-rich repeat protein
MLLCFVGTVGISGYGCGSGDASTESEPATGLKSSGKGGKAGAGGNAEAGAGGASQAGKGGAPGGSGGAPGGSGGSGGAGAKAGAAGAGAMGGGSSGKGGASGGGGSAGSGGGGTPCKTPSECNDSEECTEDACINAFCSNTPIATGQTCAGGAKVCVKGKCSANVCGDGVKLASEECDDGNGNNFDACSNTCTISKCGDGLMQAGEQCDDGNADNFDGCTSSCLKPGPAGGTGFDPGAEGSSGVKVDPNGNIIIDPDTAITKKTQNIIWIANSAEGTVSKIDTKTTKEVGRYCSAPGCKADPSRTTVGLSGDVVVANRGGGSAARIAGDITGCVDRNGNGVIDTNTGVGPVPAQFIWQAGQAESPDECVLWWTDLGAGSLPRAAGFDAEIGDKGELSVNVYIGLHATGQLLRIDGATGNILTKIPVPGNPYGLVIDKDGAVWIQSTSHLVRVDVKNGDVVKSDYPVNCMYGIAADPLGRIYTSGYSDQCLRRFDPATGENQILKLPVNAGGVAVDKDNHVWTGEPQIQHIDASGPQMVILGSSSVGGHGAAIDYDNRPWSIPLSGNNTAYKIDPNNLQGGQYAYEVATPGLGTYTYSDMTGFQLTNSAAKGGVYRHTFVGCGADTSWDSLSLDVMSPPKTSVSVSVRVAPTVAALQGVPWTKVATLPPDTSPITLNVPKGGVMQTEVTMKSADLALTPILSGISVVTSGCKELPQGNTSSPPPAWGRPAGRGSWGGERGERGELLELALDLVEDRQRLGLAVPERRRDGREDVLFLLGDPAVEADGAHGQLEGDAAELGGREHVGDDADAAVDADVVVEICVGVEELLDELGRGLALCDVVDDRDEVDHL